MSEAQAGKWQAENQGLAPVRYSFLYQWSGTHKSLNCCISQCQYSSGNRRRCHKFMAIPPGRRRILRVGVDRVFSCRAVRSFFCDRATKKSKHHLQIRRVFPLTGENFLSGAILANWGNGKYAYMGYVFWKSKK